MLALAATICLAGAKPAPDAPDWVPAAVTASLPRSAPALSGLAPRGWRIEQAVRGDLNHDGRIDVVAILKGDDPACRVRPPSGTESIDTNPRIVVIAFGTAHGYALELVNAAVIPRRDDPYMDDPIEECGRGCGLALHGDVVRLGVRNFRSAGGWTTNINTLSFRWDGRRFALIGFDRETIQRNSGETETLSANFITGRMSIAKGSIENDRPGRPYWSRIPPRPPESLETIGDALEEGGDLGGG